MKKHNFLIAIIVLITSVVLTAFNPFRKKDSCETAEVCYEQVQSGNQDALKSLTSLAEAGDPEAQYKLGILYGNGDVVEKDKDKAEYWCTLAAIQGHIDAEYWLFSHQIDYEYWRSRARAMLLPLAEQNNAQAQYMLGKFSVYKPGSLRPSGEQRDWYRKAIINGSADAFRDLYYLDYKSALKSLDELHEEDAETYRKLAESSNAPMQFIIGGKSLGNENYEDAMEWLLKAAKQGHHAAASSIGKIYEEGLGVDVDYEEAIHWYLQGNKFYQAGKLCEIKDGPETNMDTAIQYYIQASEQDEDNADSASYRLGEIYENGIGVQSDCDEAMKWYNKAADGDSGDAILKLAAFYEQGICVEKDPDRAEELYSRLKEDRFPSVQVLSALGKLYFEEPETVDCAVSVPAFCSSGRLHRDDSEFQTWLKKAEDCGCEAEVNACRAYLAKIDKDPAAAIEFYKKSYEMGNKDVRKSLAYLYFSAEEPYQNVEEGLRLFKELAAEGDADAKEYIFKLYGDANNPNALITPDPEEVFQFYQTYAEEGYPYAITRLVKAYMDGYGVQQDDEAAWQWMERYLSEENDGTLYPNWIGTKEAIKWLELQVSHGNAEAMAKLGEYYLSDYSEYYGVSHNTQKGLELLLKASELGSQDADWTLINYSDEKQIHTQQYFNLLEKYAERGKMGKDWAMLKLADYYANGWVTCQDYQKAMALYLEVAEHGSTQACCNIGFFYQHGYGVEVNYEEALKWYLKVQNGCSYYAGKMYEKGLGTDVDYETALKLYRYSAANSENHSKEAMIAMAELYEEGLGTVKNPELARYWYLRAGSLD